MSANKNTNRVVNINLEKATAEEIEIAYKQILDAKLRQVDQMEFGLGDEVVVDGSSWKGYVGTVVDMDGQWVTLSVMMGKKNPVAKEYRVRTAKVHLRGEAPKFAKKSKVEEVDEDLEVFDSEELENDLVAEAFGHDETTV